VSSLRISFAEWLFRMSQARVPYQARALAVYSVAFRVTGNDDLARLSGMDSQGKADQTFNRWKRLLRDDGWVLIENAKGGRGHGIVVTPAINKTPVEFTDLSARDPGKFNPSSVAETGVEKTPVAATETGVRKTPVVPPKRGVEVTETGVEKTPVCASRALAPAYLELPSEVVISREESPPTPSNVQPVSNWRNAFGADDADIAFVHGKLALANGTRVFWLDRFGGDEAALDLALIEAAGSLQRSGNAGLKLQVERKLASIARDRLDRDRRYAAAVKRNSGRTSAPGESRIEETSRMAAEARERMGISWER